jgi:TetR/AcrR family transcriptional regulator
MELNTETEKRIIASAEKLFYQKGKAGTSMQDIADDAGINRTLLNYYFRSKDQLFEAVFRNALSQFVPYLVGMLRSGMDLDEYLPKMVSTVIGTMIENPQIPIFVLQELSSNPDRMPQIMREMGLDPELAFTRFAGQGRSLSPGMVDPRQVIMNLLSLCIFPFAARPVIVEILFQGDEAAYLKAMEQRKELIPGIVRQMMK